MKKILIAALIFCSAVVAKAQTKDSLLNAAGDSIDIHAMVQKQIDEARIKQSMAASDKAPRAEKQASISVGSSEVESTLSGTLVAALKRIPLTYKVYAGISLLIILFITIRRLLVSTDRKSMKVLKDKIEKMREEKVGGSKENAKQVKTRKELRSTSEAYNVSEAQLSKAARKMNLSKGELILAARLRFFEVKKMQEV